MVAVTKRKLAGHWSTWSAELVATDEHGSWYFCPKGSVHTGSDAASVVLPCDGVQLIGSQTPWVAWWWAQPRWVSIDVCRPAHTTAAGIEYVDLELDLAWAPGGPVHVVDQDELAAQVAVGRVHPDEAAQVLALESHLQHRLQEGDPLFTDVGWRHLQ